MHLDITMKESLDTAVLLDGKLEKFAIEADDEIGKVKRYKTDLNKSIILDENSEPITETIEGVVKFIKVQDLQPNMI